MKEIKVVLYGLGPIMSYIASFLLQTKGTEIVGAIEIDPTKVGKDLGKLLGIEKELGIIVSNDPDAVLSKTKPEVVIHATKSYLEKVYPQIVKAIEHGANVVSTAEELAYPYVISPSLARAIDKLAKAHGVTVLGTGISPGFLHDTLVIVFTGICQRVDSIKVSVLSDASLMRLAFQKKIGAGLTIEEFKEATEKGLITLHVGLRNSIGLIADALSLELDRIEELTPEPVLAEKSLRSEYIEVKPGQVAGVKQYARGVKEGKEVITFDFRSYIGAEETFSEILIEGLPSLRIRPDFILGKEIWTPDMGTAAVIVNSIPQVINAPPGLLTMKDLPLPHAIVGDVRKFL